MAFDFQFSNEAKEKEKALWQEAETRLSKMGLDRHDVTGASVNIEKETKAETPQYLISIVLFFKPKNIVAKKKDENVMLALKQALNAVERQLKKEREKKRKKARK